MTSQKILRTSNFAGPCILQGPIIGETEKFFVVQVDWSADRGGYVGPRRFRKASVDSFSRSTGTTTHIKPCERYTDTDHPNELTAPAGPPATRRRMK